MTAKGHASHKVGTIERTCVECSRVFKAVSETRMICDDRCSERRKARMARERAKAKK